MSDATHTKLEIAVLKLLDAPVAQDLPSVVKALHNLADEASIKAAVLKLQSEGFLEITVEWKLCAATVVAGA
jgi:hypothetical protein